MNQQKTAEILELADLSDLGAADTAEMTVFIKGKPTTWKWIWAGPGHEKTIAQRKRLDRERLGTEARQEQSRVNGRKYKAEEVDPADDLKEKVTQLLERLIGWTPVKVGGRDLPFSEAQARAILSDPANHGIGGIYIQSWEFLGAETAFTKRSVTGSVPLPSAPSTSTASSKAEAGGTA